ncbi:MULTISPECIES: gene transfer agent family protein [unclassified Sphingomonas]|jgi:Phage tail tube protein, GTA-gp10|uniref:gene transfer agent family protein n=1 Tax=unclassified Sphingomonas TaxID=196159 RepID=UPI000E1091B3|nr:MULTISPECIES: gene transfer agent family protein [unclassified Sphingomonas]AXJ95485.1 gene transfer agent family protein [Sphingomonas sp. FARSPH]
MSGVADLAATPPANPLRGEAAVRVNGAELVLRPSFQALVAAEGELGPLFDLVERAVAGKLSLGETATLFWHCLREVPDEVTREVLGEALAAMGLAKLAPILRVLLSQILAGR